MTVGGACRACGDPIGRRRLEAVPDTPWCVRCAESRVARVGGVMHAIGYEGHRELEVVPSVRVARERMAHSIWSLATNPASMSEGQR